MKSLLSITLLLVFLTVCVLVVPIVILDHLPRDVNEWLEAGDSLALLTSFLVVPVVLAALGMLALVLWMRFASWIVPRQDIERVLGASIFGGSVGRFQKCLLDKFYSQN